MTRSAVATENVKLAVYEALVDAAHDALFSLDASMRVELWNRNAERVFGRHSEGVVGEPADRLFPAHVRSLLDRVLGGERVDHVETEIERKDGMPVAIALSLHPVRDATGSCCGIVGVARDVTEQRLAQAALAETEARLREQKGSPTPGGGCGTSAAAPCSGARSCTAFTASTLRTSTAPSTRTSERCIRMTSLQCGPP